MVGMTRKWKAHEDMSAWSEKRERWQEKESFIPFYFRVREFFNLYPRTRLSRSPEQDNMNKCSESLEQDLNGTARLLVRLSYDLACEQAFRGALAAEREKERELATTSLEFQVPSGSASTVLSDFRQSARSGNEREWKQALKNTCQG